MRKLAVSLVVAAVAALTVAPAFGQPRPIRRVLEPRSYFPLRDGNTWTYQKTGVGGESTWKAWVIEGVVGGQPPLGFHLLAGYFPGQNRMVRADGRGRVVETGLTDVREYLWYRLGAPVDATWEMEWAPSPLASPVAGCIAGSKLRVVSRSESLTVPAGEFHDVVHVEFTTQCADAGIVGEWFAPGVGLVRREETSFAGPVISELVNAELGDVALPVPAYTTSLSLASPRYVNNLMPPVDPGALPVVRGAITVRNGTDTSIDLVFSGCASATITVRDPFDDTVLTTHADDGGCCTCGSTKAVVLRRSALTLPFSFKLVSDAGAPLADGRYSVTVTLDALGSSSIRPSARATFDLASTH